MGYWNETCFLTNLPIMLDDRAVFIPLYPKFATFGESSPVDKFLYAGTPMVGKYNIYGIITNIDKSESAEFTYNFFMGCIKKGLIDLVKGHGENGPVNNINDLIKALERGRVIDSKTRLNFRYIMMHEEAYHKIVYEVGNRFPYNKDNPFKYYVRKRIGEIKESHLLSEETFFTECLFMGYKWYKAVVNKQVSDIIKKLTELQVFFKALKYLRKELMPTTGKGSQSSEMYLHSCLADFTKRYSENFKKRRLEECNEGRDPRKETIRWLDDN